MQKRNDYSDFKSFLSNPSFQLWVRYNQDDQGWEEWTLENPYRAKMVEEARQWLLAMGAEDSLHTPEQIAHALEKTWNQIRNQEDLKKTIRGKKRLKNNWIPAIAAVLIVALLIAGVTNLNFTKSVVTYSELVSEDQEDLVEQTNTSSKAQMITLSDGSSVLLNPNSKLSYPKIFIGNSRKVYLSGEGFFEISKNH